MLNYFSDNYFYLIDNCAASEIRSDVSSFPFHFCLNSNSYQGPGCGQVAGGDSAPQNDTDHHDHDDEGKCLESLCQSLCFYLFSPGGSRGQVVSMS